MARTWKTFTEGLYLSRINSFLFNSSFGFQCPTFLKYFNLSECQIQHPRTCSSAHLKQLNGSNPSLLIQWKTIQIHLEHFKVNQGFVIAMEWESLSHPYGRCAHIQNYIDGLRWIIYYQTIHVKRKQRHTFSTKILLSKQCCVKPTLQNISHITL